MKKRADKNWTKKESGERVKQEIKKRILSLEEPSDDNAVIRLTVSPKRMTKKASPQSTNIESSQALEKNDFKQKQCYVNLWQKWRGLKPSTRFSPFERIGSGAFGKVYLAHDARTKKVVALKVERRRFCCRQLRVELKFYSLLAGIQGIPRIHWYGGDWKNIYLVMDFVGPSLQTVIENRYPDFFSPKEILQYGLDLLSLIEQVHERGVVHCDIKPDNILIRQSDKKMFLIDFGLSALYVNTKTRKHVAFKTADNLVGTPWFMSTNAHFGNRLSRRDDLESIVYTLVFLATGKLPWVEGDQGFITKKSSITAQDLCRSIAGGFAIEQTLIHCRTLQFDTKPNYARLKKYFQYGLVKSV